MSACCSAGRRSRLNSWRSEPLSNNKPAHKAAPYHHITTLRKKLPFFFSAFIHVLLSKQEYFNTFLPLRLPDNISYLLPHINTTEWQMFRIISCISLPAAHLHLVLTGVHVAPASACLANVRADWSERVSACLPQPSLLLCLHFCPPG